MLSCGCWLSHLNQRLSPSLLCTFPLLLLWQTEKATSSVTGLRLEQTTEKQGYLNDMQHISSINI